jgi:hypothetical protein
LSGARQCFLLHIGYNLAPFFQNKFTMKNIKLKNSRRVAIVSDEDFKYLNQWEWLCQKNGNTFYVHRYENKKRILIHRIIMNAKPNQKIDHRFGNGLDNRRSKLRICTSQQNSFNSKSHLDSTSKFRGVCWDDVNKKWVAQISIKGKPTKIGRFLKEKDAAIAFNKAAKKHHGKFANLNKI